MTRIIINSEPGKYDITIDGHAEKVNEGEGNLLCAAISMVSQTFLQCMLDAQEKGWSKCTYEERDGYLRVICEYKKKNDCIKGQIIMLETGLLMLKQKYEKNIDMVGENKIKT